MNTNENNAGMNIPENFPEGALPVSQAATREAKEHITLFRSLGLADSEMMFTRDFPGGPEEVMINRAGFIKAAQATKGCNCEAIKILNENGVNLTLEEELEIVERGDRMDRMGKIVDEVFAKVEADPRGQIGEMARRTTLGEMADFIADTLKPGFPGIIEVALGNRKHRMFLSDEFRRLCLRYGRETVLDDGRMQDNPRAIAVILNALGVGESNRAEVDRVESLIAGDMGKGE